MLPQTTCLFGPSPRVWGNPGGDHSGRRPARAIPTRVGKSPLCLHRAGRAAGHPHACGEIQRHPDDRSDERGPSPRVWGNLPAPFCRRPVVRAIPTRVGKSPSTRRGRGRRAGHPHACGEIPERYWLTTPMFGPSPRVWGNLQGREQRGTPHRAIPTRVGKSQCRDSTCNGGTGHPHACGEIISSTLAMRESIGPSPRVWGNLPRLRATGLEARAIPTRVGKSLPWLAQ